MLFVHQVLNKLRRRSGYSTPCDPMIKLAEDVGDIYPYQAVKKADRCAPVVSLLATQVHFNEATHKLTAVQATFQRMR